MVTLFPRDPLSRLFIHICGSRQPRVSSRVRASVRVGVRVGVWACTRIHAFCFEYLCRVSHCDDFRFRCSCPSSLDSSQPRVRTLRSLINAIRVVNDGLKYA